jgi:uncharacterized OsmC-like protein
VKLILEGETRIRLIYDDSLELGVESPDPLVHFSPLHMLAASLATCTMAVLLAWADTIRLGTDGLEVALEWDYAEGPYRVGEYRTRLTWPALPESRRPVALRIVEQCTVEATLRHPPFIDTRIV